METLFCFKTAAPISLKTRGNHLITERSLTIFSIRLYEMTRSALAITCRDQHQTLIQCCAKTNWACFVVIAIRNTTKLLYYQHILLLKIYSASRRRAREISLIISLVKLAKRSIESYDHGTMWLLCGGAFHKNIHAPRTMHGYTILRSYDYIV